MRKRLNTLLEAVDAWRLLPLAAFVACAVLAVRFKHVFVNPENTALVRDFYVADLMSWWKSVLLAGSAAWMALHTAVRVALGKRRRITVFDCLAAAAALSVLLSALASEYPVTAWLGFAGQYEGALVQLSYVFSIWYTAEVAVGEADRRVVLRLVGVLAAANALMGIGQGLGFDFWQSAMGHFVLGADANAVTHNFAADRMAFGTVFQPNHYGLFMAMSAVLALGMAFYERAGPWYVFWGGLCALTAGGVFFSRSRAALAAAIFASVVWLIMTGLARRKRQTQLVPAPEGCAGGRPLVFRLLLPCMLACVGLLGIESVRDRLAMQWSRTVGDFSPVAPRSRLASVALSDNVVRLEIDDDFLLLEAKERDSWRARWEKDGSRSVTAIPEDVAAGWTACVIEDIPECRLLQDGLGNVLLRFDDIEVPFFRSGERMFIADPQDTLREEMLPPRRLSTYGYDALFSRRVYVWSRALPLLADNPVLGGGPGTFALIFPNDDLFGKQRLYFPGVEEKAHALWVAVLVQNGLLGFLVFAAFLGYGLAAALRRNDSLSRALFVACLAWVMGSFTNDSTPGVTPVLCVLLGVAASQAQWRSAAVPERA